VIEFALALALAPLVVVVVVVVVAAAAAAVPPQLCVVVEPFAVAVTVEFGWTVLPVVVSTVVAE
jgi:hypothetical protein